MQTSLSRRQRHRRTGAARRGGGGGSARRAALAIPILLFASFLALGGAAFIGAVSAYAYYSRDLPDPKTAFDALAFDQPSTVYDRTGAVQLAVFGANKRVIVTYDQIPAVVLDATTSVEDKDFWSNPGFDLGGLVAATIDTISGRPRGGSTITQQLVRARLLPEVAFAGTTYERKIREIIQSIRLTQAFPDLAGKQEIITAYLNQNFYGNQSYGIAAAAKGYFNKDLKDLTLAQAAILAAIPQSPSQYDLVKNAVPTCSITVAAAADCPAADVLLVVPPTADIVVRRNRVLDLMATRSVLSAKDHTPAEYEAAKNEPVVLANQSSTPWKAAQFDWQVRHQLGAILCGEQNADTCEKVDTGGYKVTTTLNWKMQQTVEKWLFAAVRANNTKNPHGWLTALGIPKADWSWIDAIRGRNINNAASAILDYRTGQVLAYSGSASYYAVGDATFQPQFDILSDGFRQPGSSIKPINYITGIDDHTMTAATMFMDVVTNFGGNPPFMPTQLDKLERGPVRLRSALQFSLNIPSTKAAQINGLDHLFQRMKDFGLTFPSGTVPVASEGIGTLESHQIDMVSAYGAIANGGVLVPREMILSVVDATGKTIYPGPGPAPTGRRVATQQAAYIITDILQQNTIRSVNPYWGTWVILENGKRRPAAYKTGTTNDNKDLLAYGYLAPPVDPKAPALVAGVWIGNSDASPALGSLSIDANSALWSRILTEASKGMPLADFKQPPGIVTATVDAFSGLLPGPYTTSTIKELFIDGTVPTRVDNMHVELSIDQATGKLWQDGCTGPMVKQGFLDFSNADPPQFPSWQPFTLDWAARAARGPGIPGGPANTRTSYFFNNFFQPFGKTWGGTFPPTEVCQAVVPPTCAPGTSFDPLATAVPSGSPLPTPCVQPSPSPTSSGNGNGPPTQAPTSPLPPLPGPSNSP